jgi:large subunit ribosomal protein L18
MISAAKEKRAKRTRYKLKIHNRQLLPRLSIFISNRFFYAQIIDDSQSHTLISCSSLQLKKKNVTCSLAAEIGTEIAKRALEKDIKKVIFDKGPYLFGSRLSSFVNAARENNLVI